MNKIIVVGHPQSGYEQVLNLLVASGMAPALPSRREGLAPEQISATLIKAHGAAPVEQVRTAQQLPQIKVAPVWQGMVLDLMLGNLEQTLWGWTDTQAVYLLDYWKEQDPQVVFVLVYDAPETALTRLTLEQAGAPQEELQRRLNAWTAYNAALLHFHLRNPQRSVLVHARQVQPSARHYLQQLSERIAAPLLQLPPSQLQQAPAESCLEETPQQTKPPAQIATSPLTTPQPISLPHNAQVTLLAGLLVDAQPQAQALYEELQAAASLPLLDAGSAQPVNRQALTLSGSDMPTYHQAWQACVEQYKLLADSAQAQQDLQMQVAQHSEAEAQFQAQWQTAQTQAKQVADALQEENELLQARLHKAGKELERLHQQGSEQAQELQARIKQHIKAEAKLKADWQAEQTQAQQSANAQQQENNLLLTQLHKVQEELERLYLQGKAQEQELKTQVKQHTEAEAKLKVQWLAAQAQAKEMASTQQQEKNQLQAQLQKAQAELNTVQKKTVSAELQEENGLLLEQLHKVQEELERYYLKNHKLKTEQKPQPKVYYGAADRIKQQLSYQLGATMINKSHSFGGWLSMPFTLHAQIKRFRLDQSTNKEQKLPPIEQYSDAHAAERTKQHLSYRLGTRMLKNAQSLGGWVTMPWALYAEVNSFRKRMRDRPLPSSASKKNAADTI
jgi:hypothetical protein